MEFAAHLALERRIDELVLSNARQTGKCTGNNARTIVVTIPRQIVNRDLGIGKGFRQMGVQRFDRHGHR